MDWKSEPTLREKALFALVPFLLLVPCMRALWLPVEGAINKSRADLKMIETQSETILKVLDLTSKETETNAAPLAADEAKSSSRALRILRRESADRNAEIAGVISAISSRDMTEHIQIKNIAVGKDVVFPNYTAIPVDVILEGGYSATERYLKAMEEIERPVLVRGIGIAKMKGEGSVLDVRLTLWVYMAGGSGPPKK